MSMRVRRRRWIATCGASLAGLALHRECRAEEVKPEPLRPEYHKLAAAYSAGQRGLSVLVMVDGQTVFEDYPNGNTAERTHELASGTKSFNGVMAACAIADGLIGSWDEKVALTITEWKDDPRRAKITLRQLLSLTSGIPGGGIGRAPAFADAIATAAVADPGERFAYGPAPFQIFGELMRRKLAKSDKKEGVLEYLHRRVLDPIGLTHGTWRKDKDGNPLLPQGAFLAARQWVKFGELVRLGGQHGDKQIVPQKLLDECFVGSQANPAYGLSWWLNREVSPEIRRNIPLLRVAQDLAGPKDDVLPDLVFAAGAGDQRLYISRQHKLVVVRQASGILQTLAGQRSQYSDREFLSRLLLGSDASGKKLV